MPDKVLKKLNEAALLDIVAELSTNRGKPSDAEILAEVRGKATQEEDDIDIVYDEPSAPPSAFEVEKTIEVLQQFTLLCDEGQDLGVLSKVNRYSQRAIVKKKETKNYQRIL